MSDEHPKTPDNPAKEIEQEIRLGRQFTFAEAIGRMGGPGIMKGASAVPPKLQAEAEIEGYLRKHLPDTGGVLLGVLVRAVKESDLLLLDEFAHPIAALKSYFRRVLDSDDLLRELVRGTDVEWGRVFGERAFFEQPGCPPHPDDPYTVESMRGILHFLLEENQTRGGADG